MLTQRLGSDTQKDPAFIDALIEKIKENPGSVDEVWLATSYGFPPLSVHKQSAETLVGVAEKFRALGIRVSLQLSNSIGHGEYMAYRDCSGLVYEGSPVEHMVGADGTVAGYCFCWNGRHMRDYVKAEIKEYVSRIKPFRVWIDDDMRPRNHAPVNVGCFCDDCIARFNKKYGSSFTRETLVQEINFGDIAWREKHIAFLRESLGDFCYEVSAAVHEACPDTAMGYQHGNYFGYVGKDYDFIYDAMRRATGKNPASRPGGGSYDDFSPNTFIGKGEELDFQNYTLPDYVEEIRPEIESLPDIVYGKSIGGTCFETSYYLASGATAMSYAIMMNNYESMEWHGKMLAAFAKNRELWLKLAETSKKTYPTGLTMAFPEAAYLRPVKSLFGYGNGSYRDFTPLRYVNIPVAFSRDKSLPTYLSNSNAAQMTDAEIRALMSRPVVTTAATVAALAQRGFSFPCTVKSIDTMRRMYDDYTDHPVNANIAADVAHHWGGQFGAQEAWALTAVSADFEPLGYYKSNTMAVEDNLATAGIMKLESGAKWAVFGFDFPQRKISSARVRQLLDAIKYISGKGFAAELLTPIQGVLQPRVNAKGETVRVCFSNTTVGDSGELTFIIRNPAGTNFRFMAQYESARDLTAEKIAEGEYKVTVPNIRPYSVGAIFAE